MDDGDSRAVAVGPGGMACDSWASVNSYDYLELRVSASRALNHPERTKRDEQRRRIRLTEGHDTLAEVRCRPNGGRGLDVMWRCVDADDGREVVGAVKMEGCRYPLDPQLFTVGSAYFKPDPISTTFAERWPRTADAIALLLFAALLGLCVCFPNVVSGLCALVVQVMLCAVGCAALGLFSGEGGSSSCFKSRSGYDSDDE